MRQRKQNLLLTKTALGVYLSICGTSIAIAPNIQNLLSRNKTEAQKTVIADYAGIAIVVVGSIATIIGRYQAGGTYTPKGLPGQDKVPTIPPKN